MALDGAYNSKQGGQKNLAPVDGLRELRKNASDRIHKSSIVSMLQEFHQETRMRNSRERQEIAETGRLMSNVRSGKLVMKRAPIHGNLTLVKPLPNQPRSDRHAYPLAQVNSERLTSAWMQSRPKYTVRTMGNAYKSQIQSNLIESVIAYYDKCLFDDYFHAQQSLQMMDYGTSIIRVSYDDRLNSISKTVPIIQNEQKTLFEGYGFCVQCGWEGTPKDFEIKGEVQPRCPHCGSYNVSEMIPEAVTDVANIVGTKEIHQGDLRADQLDIPACNWDMRKLVQHSDFFTYRSEVPVKLVRSLLGIDIEESGGEDDLGLSIVNAIGNRGGAAEGWGRENSYGNPDANPLKVALMDEEWYEPSWYAGTKLEKAEKTVCGESIPAGVPLEQIFPDGICAVGFCDMQIPIAIYNEKRTVISGVYHIQSHSGVGKGTQDAIEISEQLANAHSANLAVLKRYGAGGGYWYDKEVMSKKEATALTKPGSTVGIAIRGTMYNSVEQAIGQIQPKEISMSNLNMVAQLANLMNISFMTTDFTQGVADSNVNVNTLGGQQLLAAQNQERSAATVRLKAYMYARVFEEVVSLFRTHIKIPKFFGTDDKFSLTKGRYISGEDLPERVFVDAVPDSELPTNKFTKRMQAQEMAEKSQFLHPGGFAELAKLDPRMATWWAGHFDSDIPIYNEKEIMVVCQERIDNLKELAAEAEQLAQLSGAQDNGIGDALVDGLKRALFVNEESHAIKAQMIGEYLDDDEVAEWSPYMRAGVEALIARHYKFDRDARMQPAMLENEGQIAMQMMQMQAQAQMQSQMAQQQAQAQAAAGQQAMEAEGLQKAAELAMEEDAFAREQEAEDLNFEREQRGADMEFNRQRRATREDQQFEREADAVDHKRKLEEIKQNARTRPKPSGRK